MSFRLIVLELYTVIQINKEYKQKILNKFELDEGPTFPRLRVHIRNQSYLNILKKYSFSLKFQNSQLIWQLRNPNSVTMLSF